MVGKYTLDVWNSRVLDLVQALYGAISPNFRMVSLTEVNDVWVVQFVLEKDDTADREEIEDVMAQFYAYQECGIQCMEDVKISKEPIGWPEPPVRVVYRRRE